MDAQDNVYVGSWTNAILFKITPAGVQSQFVGSSQGYADGQGTNALFRSFEALVIAPNGNFYIADTSNNRIRQVTPGGAVTTFAGQSTAASVDAIGTNAQFNSPQGIGADTNGNLYVSDYNTHKIRKISPAAVVSTIAGTGSLGYADGIGTSATFAYPTGIAVDTNTVLYIVCASNSVRVISPTGAVTTLAGSTSGSSGHVDGQGTSALFWNSNYASIVVDQVGSLYTGDRNNNMIRKITSSGWVTTIAGTGSTGNVDGVGTTAQLRGPQGLAISSSGFLYFANSLVSTVRRIPLYASSLGEFRVSVCFSR